MLIALLGTSLRTAAFTTNDAQTIFTAYNTAFLVGGYYNGWWTGAEEIEMAEDAWENSPTTARQTIVANACNQFLAHHGSAWTVGGGSFNAYNDDISWAAIAFARGYRITGNVAFRDVAKTNWDGMYARAWDTNFTGGGLWWSTDNQYKNAAVHGPAAIAACLLYNLLGDPVYLSRAQAIYAWERRVLYNPGSGGIADGITFSNTFTSGGALTYNQGTFIGGANLLYRATGLPGYCQDAILAGKYTQNNMCSAAGILPEYSSASDLSGFNGIFARWMARFARDQNVWPAFGPWLTTNANAAWSVRNGANLAWQKWATPLGTNVPDSWGCSAAAVALQVADPSPADALQITPLNGFTVVTPRQTAPNPFSVNLVLTNSGTAGLNWSLTSTSAWLNVSATSGTLAPAGPANTVTVSLVPSATMNLAPGRYYAIVWITNTFSSAVQSRNFALIVAPGNSPLALTGYNASPLAANTATVATSGANAFDLPNNYCLYQAGLPGSTRGLPPDGAFTSPLDGTSVFQFGYGVSNSLVLGYTYPATATLTLTKPQALNSLTLLACSANTAATLGTFYFNFTNGTRSPTFNFNAPDWFGPTNNLCLPGVGRLKLSSAFGAEDNGATAPNLYQTTLNLATLGYNQPIASITFTKPSGASAQQTTGIFALSGAAMPATPTISVAPQPVINNQPVLGATFSAVAMGTAPLSYQWFFSASGNPGSYALLTDQTNTSLVLSPGLQPSDVGGYVLVVTNAYGAATSSVATLSFYRAPVIVTQPGPTNRYVFARSNVTWSVSANAALPVNYFWRQNGSNLPAAGNASLTLNSVQTGNSGDYTVVISNAFGMVTSAVATLTVVPSPAYPLAQLIVADHPLGYWRLDETSGTLAHDYLFANQGVYTPKVLLGQTVDNLVDPHKSARFGCLAASNSCVTNVNVDFATSGNAQFSLEIWVNGGPQSSDAGLITKGFGNGGEQFNLDCGGANHAFRFFVRDASGTTHGATSSVVPNNQWHHLVAVCDQLNGHVYLYVDSTNVAFGTIAVNSGLLTSTQPATFGARQSGAGTAFDLQFVGYLEEVAIYKYALSSNQVAAHFAAVANRPPAFFSNPFLLPGVTAGQSYSGNLATNASDPNGDSLIFVKVSGPTWLAVAGDGALAGTAVSSDAGTNSFVVRVADSAGLSSTATLLLPVSAAPGIIASTSWQGPNLLLQWSGGIAPYQVQRTTNLLQPVWENLGSPGSANSLSLPVTNGASFYRVFGY